MDGRRREWRGGGEKKVGEENDRVEGEEEEVEVERKRRKRSGEGRWEEEKTGRREERKKERRRMNNEEVKSYPANVLPGAFEAWKPHRLPVRGACRWLL